MRKLYDKAIKIQFSLEFDSKALNENYERKELFEISQRAIRVFTSFFLFLSKKKKKNTYLL